MSQFDFPRVHVKGKFYFNPGTANNDSIDPFDSGPVTAITETAQPVSNGMSDQDFKEWLMKMDPTKNILNGQWNIYGDMSFWFENVKVSSVQVDHKTISTDPTEYSLINSTVTINNAFALDVDPEGFSTTQLFCDNICFKGMEHDAVGDRPVWTSRKPGRAATRWINWYRNLSFRGLPGSSGAAGGLSATWQLAFSVPEDDYSNDKDKETIHTLKGGLLDFWKSIPRFNTAGKQLKGLIFRMNVYLCYPLINDADLHKNYFAKGIEKENPAHGQLIGTFAPWYEEEMASITLARYLNTSHPFTNPYSRNPFPGNQVKLAPVLARVNRKENLISLDVSNTFPEDGKSGEKLVMGTAMLHVKTPEKLIPISTFKYDRLTYDLAGGMVDVTYNREMADLVENNLLAITLSDHGSSPLLLEEELMIATDCSCVYLDERDEKMTLHTDENSRTDDHNEDREIEKEEKRRQLETDKEKRKIVVRVFQLGRPLKNKMEIEVDQWKTTPTSQRPFIPKCLEKRTISVPAGGTFTFNLDTLDGPGVRIFRFCQPSLSHNRLNIITDFMCAVRILPVDNYEKISKADLNFDLIYREVFRYYYLLLPAMNKYLPMNDASVWETPLAAEYLLRRTSPECWENFDYMPRTRDLSIGKILLLRRFCRKVLERHGKMLSKQSSRLINHT